MLDIYGINYNGVNPRPTYEELFDFVDYPVKFPDRTATFIRVSPLLTQLDGIGMTDLEELERRELIERQGRSDQAHPCGYWGPCSIAESMQQDNSAYTY